MYYHNPREYFIQYILGHKPKATPRMQFGSIGHKAIAEPSYDWRKALREGRFMSSDEKVIERALPMIKKCKQHEVELTVKWGEITLYGIIDGLNATNFRERKFSAPGAWNQDRVDEDLQISFYWFMLSLAGKKMKKAYLDHINAKTGKVVSFETKRNLGMDMEGVQNIIRHSYEGIMAEDWGS
jgi:hypothetical protein